MIPQSANLTEQVNQDTFNGAILTYTTTTTGVAIDLTGVTVRLHWRKGSARGRIVQKMELGTGLTLTDASNGKLRIDEFQISWGRDIYYGDVELTFTDGKVKTWARLEIDLRESTTNE